MIVNIPRVQRALAGTRLEHWAETLPQQLSESFSLGRHGDLSRWQAALDALPKLESVVVDLEGAVVRVAAATPDDIETGMKLESTLRELIPWRKGPFEICGVKIDTEWRSDLKWDRLKDAIEPLHHRRVLDVGCGSGYHCLRMAGAGARHVLGIEPMPLYVIQFAAINRYTRCDHVNVLPFRLEELPGGTKSFDTVFSMGVLYHRRSPIDHLLQLKGQLRAGGQLVLETLVVEGSIDTVLVPEDRYARMKNVWFIPSVEMLIVWMRKLKFGNIQCIDVTPTTPDEQRSTSWMPFESLSESLNSEKPDLTVENHPAPLRAIVTAYAP